jgi:hypothetical protein
MERIVDVHFPNLKKSLLREALECSSRSAKCRTEEEAVHVRAAGLAETADGRGHFPETLRGQDQAKIIPPLAGALPERAGRTPLRTWSSCPAVRDERISRQDAKSAGMTTRRPTAKFESKRYTSVISDVFNVTVFSCSGAWRLGG